MKLTVETVFHFMPKRVKGRVIRCIDMTHAIAHDVKTISRGVNFPAMFFNIGRISHSRFVPNDADRIGGLGIVGRCGRGSATAKH